jgi:hypothetical protein
MLQVFDNMIREPVTELSTTSFGDVASTYVASSSNNLTVGSISWYNTPYTYWQSYPVYVCEDKTKKAIDVIKALQAEKLLKCDSVPRFIALVEKISQLL